MVSNHRMLSRYTIWRNPQNHNPPYVWSGPRDFHTIFVDLVAQELCCYYVECLKSNYKSSYAPTQLIRHSDGSQRHQILENGLEIPWHAPDIKKLGVLMFSPLNPLNSRGDVCSKKYTCSMFII